jgi:hypothetical protein
LPCQCRVATLPLFLAVRLPSATSAREYLEPPNRAPR